MSEKNYENLIKKIKDQIDYLNLMKLKIKCIIFNDAVFEDMKNMIEGNFSIEKQDLGYFKCAIKYLDNNKEKINLIS